MFLDNLFGTKRVNYYLHLFNWFFLFEIEIVIVDIKNYMSFYCDKANCKALRSVIIKIFINT